MTSWERNPLPSTAYQATYKYDAERNREKQDEAAGGAGRRTIIVRYADDGTPIQRTGTIKPHKTATSARVYLNLSWTENGAKRTFRVCEATKRTRDANLKLGWDTVHQHSLSTPEGRAAYRARRPKGHR